MKKLFTILMLCLGLVSTAAYGQDDSETTGLEDYKTACLAAIDNISLIGDNFAMRSMVSLAKSSLEICGTTDDMRRVMTTLRAGVISYLQTVKTFEAGKVYTGLLGNHSFDTGDLSLWYSIGFDLSQISLTDITGAISGGDVSGLVNAVKVNEWNEDTKALENQGSNAISGGDQKYYLNSTQLIMQPIIGLPAGIYSYSAKVACTPGFLNLNKVHLCALVVPTSTVQEVIGNIIGDTSNWGELLNNFDLTQYMAPFLQSGTLYTGTANGKNLNTFSDGELRFIIDEGDIVVIGINAGMLPFIGTEQFRADNLQLTGLLAANDILDTAKAELAEALQGQEPVEANYNAELEGTQPAFTYDKTLTENYNNALLSAQDKYENDKLSDLLTKSDLNNIDGIEAKLKNHYRTDIQTLNNAKEAFGRQAFIAPATDEPFNIVMKDSWISLTTKWTGNAVTVGDDMTMSFSKKPGESIYALAFCFERASSEYTNLLRAFVNDNHDKYYLGERDGNLVLTTNQSEAVTITALPSHTEEGLINLMVGDLFLGTSSSSNVLVETNSGTLLRPTRTGLSVAPASEMELTVTVPAGWNASTMMLPFDADLPEGLNAFTVTDISGDIPYLEKESQTSLKANTPYYITAAADSYTLSGISRAILPSYEEGLLVGRHTPYTTQGTDEYVLTIEDGFYMFRRMDGQPIAENKCYLKCDASASLICVNKDDATGVSLAPAYSERKEGEMADSNCYDLYGRQVINRAGQMVNGKWSNGNLPRGIYIVGRRKVAVK